MNRSAAAKLERQEDNLPLETLVARFEKQAVHDLDKINKEVEFIHEITSRLRDFIEENGAEHAADEIAGHFQDMLKNEKVLDDRQQQIAYIIALAKEIRHRQKESN